MLSICLLYCYIIMQKSSSNCHLKPAVVIVVLMAAVVVVLVAVEADKCQYIL